MTATPADGDPAALVPRRRAVAVAVFLAAAVVALAMALSGAAPAAAVVWGSLATAAYAGALLCLAGARQGPSLGLTRWRFGSWMLLWYGLAFGLATLTWIQPQSGTQQQLTVASVLRALWLVAVGMSLWTLGYAVGPGRPARRQAARALAAVSRRFGTGVRGRATPWVLYVIGLGARISVIATTGRFGYVGDVSSAVSTATGYQQILSVLSLCAPLAVAAAALQVYRERLPGARVTLAVLFLAELALGAAAGAKQDFIVTVLAVAIPYSAVRHRLPKGVLAALALIFLVVAIPFNQAYRTAARSPTVTLSPRQALAEAPGILRQTVTGHSVAEAVPSAVDLLLKRIREIDGPAIIMQRTPAQIGFISPVQLVEAPLTALIPRAVWPEKPILATGYQFSQQYYRLPATLYTSSAITPVGDLYRHSGWVPVLAGMFLLGCGVRLLDDVLDVRASPHAIFLVLLLFPTLVKSEVGWVALLAGLPGVAAVWLLAVAITFGRKQAV